MTSSFTRNAVVLGLLSAVGPFAIYMYLPALSLVMLVVSVWLVLAPLTGGALIVPFGWRAVFVAVGIAALIALLLVAFLMPETRPAHERIPGSFRNVFGSFGELLRDWHFLGL